MALLSADRGRDEHGQSVHCPVVSTYAEAAPRPKLQNELIPRAARRSLAARSPLRAARSAIRGQTGYEKVVIYGDSGRARHAARQLADGRWTSKLGSCLDIVHNTPDDVAGAVYGTPIGSLRRPVETPRLARVGSQLPRRSTVERGSTDGGKRDRELTI
jgi:hypothetical protein